MIKGTKAIREFQSLFKDPNLGLAILRKKKICFIKEEEGIRDKGM